MTLLKKIWKDPVWSKVISVIIIAIGTILWTTFNSIINNIDFPTAWNNFWTSKIQLQYLVLIIIGILILYWLIKHFIVSPFKYDNETINLDRQVFEKIRTNLLPQTGSIYFLRYNNFAGFSFNLKNLDDLDKIEHENKNSDFEFLHPELERIKTELIKKIEYFTSQIAGETFTTNNGRQTVPTEWEIEQPKRFREVVNDLHKTAFEICDKYDELIKMGRRILKI